jgi:2-polyprenyl-3-methyl-5-hydroxy-6-metoxy-1,4-benzoquinol methylase
MDVRKDWEIVEQHHYHPAGGTDSYWESGKIWVEHLASIGITSGRLLDFGCGDGRVSKHFVDAGFRVTGYDSSLNSLQNYSKNVPGATTTSVLTGKFDVVLCLAVVIHYPYAEGKKLIKEAADRLKKGGKLIVNMYIDKERVDPKRFLEYGRWTNEELTQTLEECGLVYLKYDFHCVIAEKK